MSVDKATARNTRGQPRDRPSAGASVSMCMWCSRNRTVLAVQRQNGLLRSGSACRRSHCGQGHGAPSHGGPRPSLAAAARGCLPGDRSGQRNDRPQSKRGLAASPRLRLASTKRSTAPEAKPRTPAFAGAGSDQIAQGAACLRLHPLPQSARQPDAAHPAHRRVLADAHPA